MKKLILLPTLILFLACAETGKSYTETAQIVVESFYNKDLKTLKKYTTEQSYQAFVAVQDMFATPEAADSDFKVLQEQEDGEIAWVKFTTAYEEKPETFKLVKENDQWKVTEIGIREKGPF
ncbi:hypothetical protein [Zunongwangia sp. H14]|uniref:hypothetical protein n=1 Tax=Zunongwangia sp. H14 TaxID=3240792 RepID=UPI003565491C